MSVGSAISKMFTRQFKVPTPGVKSADGSDAKAMREVEKGLAGKVDAGKDRPAFLPPPKKIDKKIVELENADRADKLSKQDKADLKELKNTVIKWMQNKQSVRKASHLKADRTSQMHKRRLLLNEKKIKMVMALISLLDKLPTRKSLWL